MAVSDPSSNVNLVSLLPVRFQGSRSGSHELLVQGTVMNGAGYKLAWSVRAEPEHSAVDERSNALPVLQLAAPVTSSVMPSALKGLRCCNSSCSVSEASSVPAASPASSSFGYCTETGRILLSPRELSLRVNLGFPGLRPSVFVGSTSLSGELCVRLVVPARGEGLCNGSLVCDGELDRELVSKLLRALEGFSKDGPLVLLSRLPLAGRDLKLPHS